jgi:hypothetical protein
MSVPPGAVSTSNHKGVPLEGNRPGVTAGPFSFLRRSQCKELERCDSQRLRSPRCHQKGTREKMRPSHIGLSSVVYVETKPVALNQYQVPH